jgi:three-Cys-motif partner protein
MKLLMWGGAGNRLAIVDAFAGAGRDAAGNDGSPAIAVKQALKAMAELQRRKSQLSHAKVQVFAIEKDRGTFQELERTLAPFIRDTPDLVRVLRGELSEHISTIRSEVGNCPTFYFLDPYGIKGLDASTYPVALAGPHNEIFALFANIGAVRLHGLVNADRADPSSQIEKIMASPSLFPEHDAEAIEAVQADAARANEALDSSVPASREYLNRALGGETWKSTLDRTPPRERADAFLQLFQDVLLSSGARNVLTVPMRDDSGLRKYALVHASKSLAGLLAMKKAVSAGLNRANLSGGPRAAMKRDLSVNVPSLLAYLRRVLAGTEIPWAEERTGLKDLLLARTPLFDFQLAELKKALKDARILVRSPKETCVFPP